MNILLDPYILAVPEQVERAESYMQTLGDWMIAANRAGDEHRYWLSGKLFDALNDANCYPNWETLYALETRLPPNRIDNPLTLLRAFEQQLMNPPLFDELFHNTTLYDNSDQVSIIPPAIIARLPVPVSQALQETLIYAAIGKELQTDTVFDDLVFGTSQNGFHDTELGVDFLAQDIKTEQVMSISQTWAMLFSPEELNVAQDIVALWKDAQKTIQYVYAALEKEGKLANASLPLPRFLVQRSFNASIRDLSLDTRPRVLEQIFRKIVLGAVGVIPRYQSAGGKDGKNPHHPLKNPRGQIERGDKAKAWRLNIYSNSYRLHYWLLPDGTMELSKVCIHEDYTIE